MTNFCFTLWCVRFPLLGRMPMMSLRNPRYLCCLRYDRAKEICRICGSLGGPSWVEKPFVGFLRYGRKPLASEAKLEIFLLFPLGPKVRAESRKPCDTYILSGWALRMVEPWKPFVILSKADQKPMIKPSRLYDTLLTFSPLGTIAHVPSTIPYDICIFSNVGAENPWWAYETVYL